MTMDAPVIGMCLGEKGWNLNPCGRSASKSKPKWTSQHRQLPDKDNRKENFAAAAKIRNNLVLYVFEGIWLSSHGYFHVHSTPTYAYHNTKRLPIDQPNERTHDAMPFEFQDIFSRQNFRNELRGYHMKSSLKPLLGDSCKLALRELTHQGLHKQSYLLYARYPLPQTDSPSSWTL